MKANRYLNFSLGNEEFGIPLLDVREVIAVPEITPVPYTPPHFLGIMNLRGQVISVMDLRTKLGVKGKISNENSVIICDLNPLSIGVVVDSINQVLSPNEEEIQEKPEIESRQSVEFITGVIRKENKLILLLDILKLLNLADKAMLERAQKDYRKAG